MKQLLIHSRTLTLALALVALFSVGACKHSGMAVTADGRALSIDIDVPTDLSEGDTQELKVEIRNRGVNRMKDVVFEVEMPNELIVLSTVPGDDLRASEMMTASGRKQFIYRAGDIDAQSVAHVKYHVRAAFGSLDRTGDIRVTAWSEDLPGDRLVETKNIHLRR